MKVWCITYRSTEARSISGRIVPFIRKWHWRKCDAKAAEVPAGYEAFSLRCREFEMRSPRGLLDFLNEEAGQ